MKKIEKIIISLKLLFYKPSLINLISNSDYYWIKRLEKRHPQKKQLATVDIQEIVPNFNQTLSTFSFLGGGSLPTDIMLIKAMCKQVENCSYFEIGTWRGESVINMATVAKECYTLNLSREEILQQNLPEKYADLHGYYSKGEENITHLLGNSKSFDFKGLAKKFDVIFIDGNHAYDFVKNDTKKVFTHLVKENSIVIWHDYAYHPEQVRSEVLLGILDGIPKKYQENLYHVSNTLCAIYYPSKLKNTLLDFPIKPENNFMVNVKAINKTT